MKQRITGKKNRTDHVKTANTAKRLSSCSIFTLNYVKHQFSVWKHQIPCVTCHCYVRGFGCSLHSLLSKQGNSFSQMTTGTDGDPHWAAPSASLQVAHQYWRWTCQENFLKWEFPAWRKKVVTSIFCLARPGGQTASADGSCPLEHQLGKRPKAFLCHLGEHHYLSPLTNQVLQQRNEMLSVISVFQMENGKMKCSSLLQTDLSVISWAIKHKLAFV